MNNVQSPLVSIISPCYNGEKYIRRMLDSFYNQDYSHLEIILVNDGSTDKTAEVIMSYKQLLEDKGCVFKYIYEENAGQSAAINKALNLFSGDYIQFVDSDDFLSLNAISKKVAYMENHPETGLLVNRVNVLDFDTLEPKGIMQRKIETGKEDHFIADIIYGKNVFYTPGGYFFRTSMFLDAMPKPLEIQAPREIGQNFQLIIPIAYKYPVAYIEDALYNYLVRPGSHSRTKHTLAQYLHNWEVASNVLKNIFVEIEPNKDKRIHIDRLIDSRYYKESMNLCREYHDGENYKKYKEQWLNLQCGQNKYLRYQLIIKFAIESFYNNFKSKIFRLISR